MSKRIGDIIAKIYRHPDDARQVITMSRAEAERIPLLPGVAVISIGASQHTPAKLPPYEHLLRLYFSDVDFMKKDLSIRAKKNLLTAMTQEQAKEVIEYVSGLPVSIHTLIIHCAGGYSRSAGVAAALHEIFGYAVENEKLKEANSSVKKALIAACSRG